MSEINIHIAVPWFMGWWWQNSWGEGPRKPRLVLVQQQAGAADGAASGVWHHPDDPWCSSACVVWPLVAGLCR